MLEGENEASVGLTFFFGFHHMPLWFFSLCRHCLRIVLGCQRRNFLLRGSI